MAVIMIERTGYYLLHEQWIRQMFLGPRVCCQFTDQIWVREHLRDAHGSSARVFCFCIKIVQQLEGMRDPFLRVPLASDTSFRPLRSAGLSSSLRPSSYAAIPSS